MTRTHSDKHHLVLLGTALFALVGCSGDEDGALGIDAVDAGADRSSDSGSDDDLPNEDAPPVPPTTAFAVLGDSNSDEYRADDNRGGAYSAVTLNWVEQLVIARGLDFGEWGTWGGARRSGFEYNWARSGARVKDLLAQGQAAGVAEQVMGGDVDYVFIHIGANDFHLTNGTYRAIYDGNLSDAELSAKQNAIVGDLTSAVDLVLAAGPEAIVLTTLGDPGMVPTAALDYPDVDGRARVSAAIEEVNQALVAMAEIRATVHISDLAVMGESILGGLDESGNLIVGGEAITLVVQGNEPHHARLDDGPGHAGTVLNGIMANDMFIAPLGEVAPFAIAPLTDAEILGHAGI